MSSNLLKRSYTNIQQEETRIINTNDLVAKRIEELSVKMKRPENEGFVSGLQSDTVEIPPEGENEAEQTSGNVIKADEKAENLLSQARTEADTILAEADAKAQEIVRQAKEQAEKEKQQALEQARQQGYREGQEKAGAENKRLEKEWNDKKKQLDDAFQKELDELEPQFVDTITKIYEHIFHVELHSYREILGYLISTTMRKIEGNRNFIIHVSKEDYPYISMQKKQITAGATAPNCVIEVVEDLTLSKNQCLIETEGGIFDCGVDTQLTELRQKLKLLSYEG